MNSLWRRIDHRLQHIGHLYRELVLWLVDLCRRRARPVLVGAILLTGLSFWYSATHFAVDTNTSNVLSRDLPFQRLERVYHQAFPQEKDTIVVVLSGNDSALASQAADRLAAWVKAHPRHFAGVYVPGGGEFFERNGILFLDSKDVQSFANRITDAQPLIARLSRDPSLKGLLDLLDMAVSQTLSGGQRLPGLASLFEQMTAALQAQMAGRFYQVHWGALMAGGQESAQERQRFVIINPRLDYQSLTPAAESLRALRAGIAEMNIGPAHGVTVGITGEAVLDTEQLKTVSEGAGMALALTLGLEILLLVVALRSARLVISVLLSLIAGMIITTALALMFIGPFNLISVAFAILFIGLGVDFGIQFCMRYREERQNGSVHGAALRRVAVGLGGALTLAAMAASLSFFSFVPTSYAGIVDLGLISGTSMFIALLTTLTVLPALLTVWPVKGEAAERDFPRLHSTLPMGRHPIRRYGRWVLGATLVLGIAAIPLVARVEFDFNPMDLIDPHAEGVKVFRQLLREPGTSPYRIEIITPNLSSAEALASRLNRVPSVSQAVTVASFVPEHQQEKLAILQNLQILVPPFSLLMPGVPPPASPDLAGDLTRFARHLQELARAQGNTALGAQAARLSATLAEFQRRTGNAPASLTELQNRITGGLPTELRRLGMALSAGPVTLADLPGDLRDRYLTRDGRARVEVFSRLDLARNANMETFVAQVREVAPQAVGAPVMLVEGGNAVLGAFREATVIALVLITLLLLLVTRHWVDTLLVMVPLLLAAVFTVAAMALLGLSFNLGNIIVLPLLIGLGVAFGIYLVARWRHGTDIAHLLQTSTPMAVFFSGLTTLSSFGSMAVSRDPGMASLGKALSLALVMVLLCILVVLPAMLMILTPSPKEEGQAGDGTQP